MLIVSTQTHTGKRETGWKYTDKFSLRSIIVGVREFSLSAAGRPRSVEIFADDAELDYLLEAIRLYENKLAGVADACIYCNNNLHQDTRDGNVCGTCNSF